MPVFLFAALSLLGPADAAPDPEVRKLQTELIKTLKSGIQAGKAEYEAGRGTVEAVLKLAKSLREAELDIATKPAERIAAHLAFFKLAVEMDELTFASFELGRCRYVDFSEIRALRLRAEIELRKAGGKPPAGTKPPASPKLAEKD